MRSLTKRENTLRIRVARRKLAFKGKKLYIGRRNKKKFRLILAENNRILSELFSELKN